MKLNEFEDIKKQWMEGLITDIEFLLAVQLDERQARNLINARRLPYKAAIKIALADLEPEPDNPQQFLRGIEQSNKRTT